jgi:alpha-tubulin suppressor-like RCC1 family protein
MTGVKIRRALAIMLAITLTTISLGTFAVPAAAVEAASPAGTVWAWGYNYGGELGNGTNISSNIPVQVSMPILPRGVTITNIASCIELSITDFSARYSNFIIDKLKQQV